MQRLWQLQLFDGRLQSGSLDAAGQQALAALQQRKVQSIDLATMNLKLADGSQVQASTEQLKAQVLGTQVWVDPTYKNLVVAVALPEGKRQLSQYITFMEDMSVRQELFKPGLTSTRKAEQQALARKCHRKSVTRWICAW